MPKFFVSQEKIVNNEIKIVGVDVNHIKNVLRKKIGDTIIICNSELSIDYLCEITDLKEREVIGKIVQKLENNAEPKVKVSIYQGIPKADKMELIIQKSVELGVYDITPVQMNRCVVKLETKNQEKKLQRWQKIAEVAAKQSGRNRIPKINSIIPMKNICNLCQGYDIVLVAYENEREDKLKYELEKLKLKKIGGLKVAVVIGPEGGFEQEEINCLKQKGAKIVTLGKRILRTETVALSMISILMYELE